MEMTAGHSGQSGQSVQWPVGQELNKEEDHVMPLVILAPALQFRPENAAWANVTAEVRRATLMPLSLSYAVTNCFCIT